MKRDRCPTCHAERDEPCRALTTLGGPVRWVNLTEPHPARYPVR